jgi:hypothetical protein
MKRIAVYCGSNKGVRSEDAAKVRTFIAAVRAA